MFLIEIIVIDTAAPVFKRKMASRIPDIPGYMKNKHPPLLRILSLFCKSHPGYRGDGVLSFILMTNTACRFVMSLVYGYAYWVYS